MDKALTVLHQAVARGFWPGMPDRLQGFEPVRDDPRFQAIAEMGRTQIRDHNRLLFKRACSEGGEKFWRPRAETCAKARTVYEVGG